jgi:hypothetical protein
MRKRLALLAAGAGLALLAGCSTPQKMYPGREPANLVVKTRVDAGSFTSAGVALDIHRMESLCKMHYEGRVWFDGAETRIGLPVDQPMFLSFGFASKNFMSGSGGSFRQNTTFVARPGHTYVAEVSYVRGIYDVQLRETRPGVSGGRLLELRPLPPC